MTLPWAAEVVVSEDLARALIEGQFPGLAPADARPLGAGFDMMHALGIISRRPRIVVAQAAHANPLYLSYQTGFREYQPVAAQPTLASAIQIGNPVSFKKAVATLKRFDGVVEQATEAELC